MSRNKKRPNEAGLSVDGLVNFNSFPLNSKNSEREFLNSSNQTTGRKSMGGVLTAIPSVPPPPKPTNEQLSLLYNNCVKLLNENVTKLK